MNMKAKGFLQSLTPGATVSYMTRYGLVVRRRSFPRQVYSEAAQRSRASFGLATQQWRALTDAERAAWGRRAAQASSRQGLQQSGPLSGHTLYVKINCARAAAGLAFVRLPPKVARFSPSPVGALSITRKDGEIEMQLSVPRKPGKQVLVLLLGAAPCSAGRSSTTPYAILGLLPAPKRGVSNIRSPYVKRYGVPAPGQRVFIRTRQLINGWEDEPKETNALVPRL
jgi:hypothetical protein